MLHDEYIPYVKMANINESTIRGAYGALNAVQPSQKPLNHCMINITI